MNEQKIHDLLQRYFDGATSLNEERELQRFFAGKDIPGSLKTYQPLFAFFAEERAVKPPTRRPSARTIRLNWTIVTGIAASIAILFLVNLPKTQPDMYAYYIDGQRVYNEAAAIEAADDKLQLLVASMQKAQNSMAAFERVQDSHQSLQNFSKISNAYQRVEKELGIRN
jgi:hypothetical protein